MRHFLSRSHKSLVSNVALWTSLLNFLSSDFCYTNEMAPPQLATSARESSSEKEEPKYTVNFNQVPIIEVIRFVSKIANINFLFSEEDLQFSVTIVSEEPIAVRNILSALIQVLRIHDLMLLEQDNNLLITKSMSVNQIPTIVSGDLPNSANTQSPIVTRVFRIKNANVNSIANIIRPMTSKGALIEISSETRQLIVTDITTNVEKIASLLVSLDAPHTPLEIESYEVKNIAPSDLITLASQILSPFSEGNPLIFVPQAETNTIFVVSTPYLIDRAIAIMEDIDIAPKSSVVGGKPPAESSPHLYRIQHRSPQDLLTAIQEVSSELQKAHGGTSNLSQALKSVKYIADTNSLFFLTDDPTWSKVQEILSSIDTPAYIGPEGAPSFYIYKLEHSSESQFRSALEQTVKSIKDPNLQETISHMKWVEETHSFVFSGSAQTIEKLKGILPTLDVSTPIVGETFYIYKLQHTSQSEMRSALRQMAETIHDKDLIAAIDSMKWIPESTSFVFTGSIPAIQQIKEILPTLDVSTPMVGETFYIYKLQNASESEMRSALHQMAETIHDKDLIATIDSIKWIAESHSFVFTGPTPAIQKLKEILPTLDISMPTIGRTFYIYKVEHASQSQVERALHQMAGTIHDKDLIATIDSMKWIAESNSLVFSGPAPAIQKLKEILPTLDVATPTLAETFFIYKLQHASRSEMQSALDQMANTLHDKELIETIHSMKWISESSSFVFTGPTPAIQKLKEILPSLDVATPTLGETFYIYKLQHASQSEMQSALDQMANTLHDKELIETIHSMKWISESSSFVFTGPTPAIQKLKEILPTLDVATPTLGETFYIYKLQHASQSEMQSALDQMAETIHDKELAAAIRSMKWISESSSFVFTGPTPAIQKLKEILPTLDVSTPTVGRTFYIYKIEHSTNSQIQSALDQMAETIHDKELIETIHSMKWIAESNSLIFSGPAPAIQKLKEVLPTVDVSAPAIGQAFYIYKLEHSTESEMQSALEQMADTIHDKDLSETIRHMKWIPESRSLVFSGPAPAIQKLKEILPTLDVSTPTVGRTFYIYKIQHASEKQLSHALEQMASTIQDPSLVQAIHSMKWIPESRSLIFSGSDAAISKLKEEILPTLDVEIPSADISKSHFLIYNPKYQKGSLLEQHLEQMTRNLKESGLSNPDLLNTLESMKWVPETNSLLFTGDTNSLDRVQTMLQTLDVPTDASGQVHIFMYKPVYASEEQLEDALRHFAQNLDPSSPADQRLASTIQSAEWIKESQSFLFKGDNNTLGRLKEILSSLDNPQGLTGGYAKGFYLYKLQYAPGNVVIENLKSLSSNLSSSDVANKNIIRAIDHLKYVKDNNSILITGSPFTIDQIKTLIAEFDTQGAAIHPAITPKSEFYIYKPVHQKPEAVEKSLSNLTKDLEESGLVDPDLLHSLHTMRYVSSTQSLLFTGTPEALSKVKGMLQTIDVPTSEATPIQKIGTTTFFIYKIKQAGAPELVDSLKSFANQLSVSNIEDKDLAASINSVKYIKETNSLLFTGTEETLLKVEKLVEKFDVSSLHPQEPVREAPSTFVVYTPKYQSGQELIGVLCDFLHNLQGSGVEDKGLFDAIRHLKFIEKTNSLIISGDAASIEKVQELLTRFDIPSKEAKQPAISTIDTANFLIYKLQYHEGSEIQTALKQVAVSLSKSDTAPNKTLIDAIDSLQWIKVTNSLLGTGDPEILSKLKDLIQNLDVPLRQVFIEVLVIETSMFNSQNFGLQWGGQLQYLNKTIGAMGNFPTATANTTGIPTGTPTFSPSITNTTAANPPVQGSPSPNSNSVPFTSGFDLGVIGDIIMHKGKSFLSLGSLVNALQVDNDTTVVMNPKIITQDGHTSSIFVGQNIPFVGSFVSNTTNSTLQTSNIEYRDVGVNLTITPTLGTNNVITLDISQDISEQVQNTTQVQGSQVTGIQTSHTTMATRVHVPNKHFLVLSGMIQDTKTHFRSSIPCLGGIPVIGAMFAEDDRFNSKANVIIFMRPYIINSFEDYDRLTAEEEDLYKDQAKLQTLKEEFDDGTEMIKSMMND